MRRAIVAIDMMIERNGSEQEIIVDGYVIWNEDTRYGADADGNRGVKRIAVYEVQDIFAHDDNDDEIKLTESEIERAAEKIKIKFLEG
jgi:hypothetical protein